MATVKSLAAALFNVSLVTFALLGVYVYNFTSSETSVVFNENGNLVTFTIFHGDVFDNEVKFTFLTPGRYVVVFVNRNLATGDIELVSGVVRLSEDGKGEFEQTIASNYETMQCSVVKTKNGLQLVLRNVNPSFIPPKIIDASGIVSPFHFQPIGLKSKDKQA